MREFFLSPYPAFLFFASQRVDALADIFLLIAWLLLSLPITWVSSRNKRVIETQERGIFFDWFGIWIFLEHEEKDCYSNNRVVHKAQITTPSGGSE